MRNETSEVLGDSFLGGERCALVPGWLSQNLITSGTGPGDIVCVVIEDGEDERGVAISELEVLLLMR